MIKIACLIVGICAVLSLPLIASLGWFSSNPHMLVTGLQTVVTTDSYELLIERPAERYDEALTDEEGELVYPGIGDLKTQMRADGYDFTESSKISVANASVWADAETGEAIPITVSGIVAFLRDEDMVKAYFGDLYSWEVANVRERATNHGEEAETGYAVEPHANGWVFYVAE